METLHRENTLSLSPLKLPAEPYMEVNVVGLSVVLRLPHKRETVLSVKGDMIQ